MAHRLFRLICTLLFLWRVNASSAADTSHLIVSFPSDGKMMLGYLYRPEGNGPFPAVIYNHGDHLKSLTEGEVAQWQPMAKLFTSHGYILFLPDRHTENIAKTEYSAALQRQMQSNPASPAVKNQQTIERLDLIHKDVDAALRWLRQQPDVDPKRIAMAGHLSGAVQTLYGSETSEIRAIVAFSPGFTFWKTDTVLRGILTSAVRKSQPPIFLIYAQNNPILEPAETLGRELALKGKPNRSYIYPPFGETGKYLSLKGTEIWGKDVLAFLEQTMQPATSK